MRREGERERDLPTRQVTQNTMNDARHLVQFPKVTLLSLPPSSCPEPVNDTNWNKCPPPPPPSSSGECVQPAEMKILIREEEHLQIPVLFWLIVVLAFSCICSSFPLPSSSLDKQINLCPVLHFHISATQSEIKEQKDISGTTFGVYWQSPFFSSSSSCGWYFAWFVVYLEGRRETEIFIRWRILALEGGHGRRYLHATWTYCINGLKIWHLIEFCIKCKWITVGSDWIQFDKEKH